MDTDNGFISCSAVNQFGTVYSRKARLRVLNGQIASEKLLIKVKNVSNNVLKDLSTLPNKIKENDYQTIQVNKIGNEIELMIHSNPQRTSPTFQNRNEMLDLASRSRRDLATTAAKFVNLMQVNDSKNLIYESELNICEDGYHIDQNNFMCGKFF